MIDFESDIVLFVCEWVIYIFGCLGKGCEVEINDEYFLIELF